MGLAMGDSCSKNHSVGNLMSCYWIIFGIWIFASGVEHLINIVFPEGSLWFLVVLVFFFTFNGIIFKLCSTKITCDSTFVTFSGSIFFLANYGSIVSLGSDNITFDRTFLTFGCTLIFFLTFDGVVLTLCSTNITFDFTFVTCGGPFFSFSYLMVLLSY